MDIIDLILGLNPTDYSVENKEDEIILKFTIPGTPKEDIKVESFEDRLEVIIGKKKKILPLYKGYFNYGEVTAEYKLGILTIKIKKDKQVGKIISI